MTAQPKDKYADDMGECMNIAYSASWPDLLDACEWIGPQSEFDMGQINAAPDPYLALKTYRQTARLKFARVLMNQRGYELEVHK